MQNAELIECKNFRKLKCKMQNQHKKTRNAETTKIETRMQNLKFRNNNNNKMQTQNADI